MNLYTPRDDQVLGAEQLDEQRRKRLLAHDQDAVHAASQSSAGMNPSTVAIRFMVAPSGEHPQTITMDRPPQTINAPHDDRERRVGLTSGAEVAGRRTAGHRTAGRGTLRDHSRSSRI